MTLRPLASFGFGANALLSNLVFCESLDLPVLAQEVLVFRTNLPEASLARAPFCPRDFGEKFIQGQVVPDRILEKLNQL